MPTLTEDKPLQNNLNNLNKTTIQSFTLMKVGLKVAHIVLMLMHLRVKGALMFTIGKPKTKPMPLGQSTTTNYSLQGFMNAALTVKYFILGQNKFYYLSYLQRVLLSWTMRPFIKDKIYKTLFKNIIILFYGYHLTPLTSIPQNKFGVG